MKEKKKYTNLKRILRNQVDKAINVLWTWERGDVDHFTMIYENYGNDLRIYTPQQLLEEIENE